LQVDRVETPPSGIDDPLWDGIAPFTPPVTTASAGLLYGACQLNVSGTFEGTADFNGGQPANLELRGVHDGEKLYILAEWSDTTFNLDRRRWLFDGPTDPLKPEEPADGWTSQLNDDKIAFAFEIEAAESGFGTFEVAGCGASCHNVEGTGLDMRPAEGKVDIWHWKTSRSEPLGYVDDQVSTPDDGRVDDTGTSIENRDRVSDNCSGPAVEWDGTTQDFTRWDGEAITLDPAYIILDGHDMPFEGNAAAGDVTYDASCAVCHGSNGQGGIGPALNTPDFTRDSRAELDEEIAAPTHPGAAAYDALSAEGKNDLVARLRGFSGIPGYFLTQPSGSVADIVTQSNVDYTEVEEADLTRTDYQLLIIRDLDTGNDDDASFEPGGDYVFGVALMDNDGRNHVGARREIMSLAP
jgi:cytochrome c553